MIDDDDEDDDDDDDVPPLSLQIARRWNNPQLLRGRVSPRARRGVCRRCFTGAHQP